MASVSYRKVGDRWHIRLRKSGHQELTKTYPGSLQERTIAEKTAWWKEQIAMGREDPWEDNRRQQERDRLEFTLREAIDWYIKDGLDSGRWKIDHKGHSTTAKNNRVRLGYFADHAGDIPVKHLSRSHIDAYIRDASGNAYTMKSYLATINTFMKRLWESGHKDNLVKGQLPAATKKKAKQIEQNPRGISFYELKKLCVGVRRYTRYLKANKFARNYQDANWAINVFALMFALMMRRQDLNRLYPADFSRDLSTVTFGNFQQSFRPEYIPKGGIKTVPTTALARRILRAMGVPDMRPGRPIITQSERSLRNTLYNARDRIFPGQQIRLHDLRHGGVMHYRSQGWPESLVSQLARHESSEVTTRMYGGMDASELKKTLARYEREI